MKCRHDPGSHSRCMLIFRFLVVPAALRRRGGSSPHGGRHSIVPSEPSRSVTGSWCGARIRRRPRKARNNTPATMGDPSPTCRCRIRLCHRVSDSREHCVLYHPSPVTGTPCLRRGVMRMPGRDLRWTRSPAGDFIRTSGRWASVGPDRPSIQHPSAPDGAFRLRLSRGATVQVCQFLVRAMTGFPVTPSLREGRFGRPVRQSRDSAKQSRPGFGISPYPFHLFNMYSHRNENTTDKFMYPMGMEPFRRPPLERWGPTTTPRRTEA